MVLKLINATAAKPGTTILWEGAACNVRSNDISKTGKHGASKCRIEAIGIFDSKKRVITVPGDNRLEVPMVEKRRAQILSLGENKVNVMDLENFETLDLVYMEELKDELAVEKEVEYWDVEGSKCIMRVL